MTPDVLVPGEPNFLPSVVTRRPIRDSILEAVVARLKTITTGNGYNLNIGDNVFRARRRDDTSLLPMIVVWDASETTSREFGNRVATLSIGVEVIVEYTDDDGPSEILNLAIADILTCMFSQTGTLRDITDDIVETTNNTAFPEAGKKVSGMQVGFQIKYTTITGDPYTQVI